MKHQNIISICVSMPLRARIRTINSSLFVRKKFQLIGATVIALEKRMVRDNRWQQRTKGANETRLVDEITSSRALHPCYAHLNQRSRYLPIDPTTDRLIMTYGSSLLPLTVCLRRVFRVKGHYRSHSRLVTSFYLYYIFATMIPIITNSFDLGHIVRRG